MRVRILKAPRDSEFIPFDVSRFRPGEVYEVGPRLAELLIVCGYAIPEEPQQRPVTPGVSTSFRHATFAILRLTGQPRDRGGNHVVLRMRYADARDASRKSTWIDDSHPPEAAQP